MNYVRIEYIDYGVQGENGFFGKVVAATEGIGSWTDDEIEHEVQQVRNMFGDHIVPRFWSEQAALTL